MEDKKGKRNVMTREMERLNLFMVTVLENIRRVTFTYVERARRPITGEIYYGS